MNDRTAKDNATSAQYLVATPKAGLTAADVRGYDDFTVVSKIKYPGRRARANSPSTVEGSSGLQERIQQHSGSTMCVIRSSVMNLSGRPGCSVLGDGE